MIWKKKYFIYFRNEIERKILREKLQTSLQKLQGNNDNTENKENERISGESVTLEKTLAKIESLQNLVSISSLANILQTSSTNVLNVDFWKNTFSFR